MPSKKEKNMKKDARPIWIYLVVTVVVEIIIGATLGAKAVATGQTFEMNNQVSAAIMIITDTLIAIIFLLLYGEKLLADIKRINLKTILFVLISATIIVVANDLLTNLLEKLNIHMDNQDSIIEYFKVYKVPMIFAVALFAPIIEEIIFRYSIGTLINNKTVFIIISSIVFGLLHGVGIATLLYILIGVALAFTYLKTDKNIITNIIIHSINNLVSVIMILVTFK